MVTIDFRTFLTRTVQDGLIPIPKARLDIINLIAGKHESKGLVLMTMKSGEIMWVHPDILKDEQWEYSKSRLKGKSCNVAAYDDIMTIGSLSDSKEEKLTLAAQPATFQ